MNKNSIEENVEMNNWYNEKMYSLIMRKIKETETEKKKTIPNSERSFHIGRLTLIKLNNTTKQTIKLVLAKIRAKTFLYIWWK